MNKYKKSIPLQKNKVLILFLVRFFTSYILMVSLYNIYLSKTQKKEMVFTCAPITKVVANQSASIIKLFGYKIEMPQHKDELSFKVLVNNKYVARVIEGCNGVSVIILFLAFIIAFSGSLKATVIFGFLGGFVIYIINLFRIAVISILYFNYPKMESFFHDILFPAIIYGTVFLLWVIWVNKFSKLKKN